MPRRYQDWQAIADYNLRYWWDRWGKSLERHDDLLATIRDGDNCAFMAKQMGLGRSTWLARTLVEADMWDRQVLVLCAPIVKRLWCEQMMKEGFSAQNVTAMSVYLARQGGIRSQFELHEAICQADVLIIEPQCRPKTKQFAGLAKQVREAGRNTQIITTSTLVWSSTTQPPRYADSCLKLLGYLDETPKVCWAEDCWKGADL